MLSQDLACLTVPAVLFEAGQEATQHSITNMGVPPATR